MGVWYATIEDVKSALDVKASAYSDRQIGRALESASRAVEGQLNRKFYPQIDTRYFDWPNQQYAWPQSLWLEQHEVVSVTTLVAGGTTITSNDYFLEPNGDGPPYDRIDIDLSSSASFSAGDTSQRSIAVTGVFGYGNDTEAATTLAEDLDNSETGVDVADSGAVGVGDVLLVDSEYMTITGKAMASTSQTLQTPLTAATNGVTVAVTTGSAYHVGETILLDSERMLIMDIAGNNLTVKRAYDGTVLAAHTGSTIYAPRTLTVVRGALGSTKATHLTNAAVLRHVVPGLVRDLTIAEAIVRYEQETAGYARTVGSGENLRNASLSGINDLRRQARGAYGRLGRMRAV